MKFGRRLEISTTRKFRWLPDAGVHWMNASFCGGIHFYWLWLAVDYDHLTRAWKIVKKAGGA